jgi:AbrB family looped-hinge helix DNA binding protein
MKVKLNDIELTRLSSKGQIVLPNEIREKLNLEKGTIFAITTSNGMIILRKMETGMKPEDLETLKLVEEAWEDIEKGRYKSAPPEEFFQEMKKW